MNEQERYFVDPITTSPESPLTAIDGDTVKCTIDRGYGSGPWKTSLRLFGLDAPETKKTKLGGNQEKIAGKVVHLVAQQWINDRQVQGLTFYHTSDVKPKYFGRTIGRLICGWPTHDPEADDCLNTFLLDKQLVRPYSGEKRMPWPAAECREIVERGREILGIPVGAIFGLDKSRLTIEFPPTEENL